MKAVANFSADKSNKKFIDQLRRDYPQFEFKAGSEDHWSAKSDTITFNPKRSSQLLNYSVLHELAHALLGHTSYNNDFELLKLEAAAWELAAKIGRKYKVEIDNDHIQNCLDTYRDWLHKRSACPKCGTHVLQTDTNHYFCYNCRTTWKVTSKNFARPYRRLLSGRLRR